MRYPDKLIQRFWAKVAICPHGQRCMLCCWPWLAGTCRGYGTFGIPKAYRHGKSVCERANRVCWIMKHGMIPDGKHVLHNCPNGDNPGCVNPAHLWLGTIDDNQKDSMRKGRRPTGDKHGLRLHPEAVQRGENNPQAKLTSRDVIAIRRAGERGGLTHRQLADGFNVSRANIGLILQGRSWSTI